MHKPLYVIEHKSRITGQWRESHQWGRIKRASTAGRALAIFGRLMRRLKLPHDDFRLRRIDQAH